MAEDKKAEEARTVADASGGDAEKVAATTPTASKAAHDLNDLETVEVEAAKPASRSLDVKAAHDEPSEQPQTLAISDNPEGDSVELIKKRRLGRKGWLVVGIVVLVLAVGGLAVWQFDKWRNNRPLSETQQAEKYDDVALQARQQADLRNYGEQVTTLEGYLQTDPPETQADPAKFELAQAYVNNGQYDRAIELYKELEKKDVYRLDARRGLGRAYLANGERGEARAYFQKVLDEMKTKTDPESKFQITEDEANLNALEE